MDKTSSIKWDGLERYGKEITNLFAASKIHKKFIGLQLKKISKNFTLFYFKLVAQPLLSI